jgi:hypothetical protein
MLPTLLLAVLASAVELVEVSAETPSSDTSCVAAFLQDLDEHTDVDGVAAFSPDGQRVVTRSRPTGRGNGRVKLWFTGDIATATRLMAQAGIQMEEKCRLQRAAFQRDPDPPSQQLVARLLPTRWWYYLVPLVGRMAVAGTLALPGDVQPITGAIVCVVLLVMVHAFSPYRRSSDGAMEIIAYMSLSILFILTTLPEAYSKAADVLCVLVMMAPMCAFAGFALRSNFSRVRETERALRELSGEDDEENVELHEIGVDILAVDQ